MQYLFKYELIPKALGKLPPALFIVYFCNFSPQFLVILISSLVYSFRDPARLPFDISQHCTGYLERRIIIWSYGLLPVGSEH